MKIIQLTPREFQSFKNSANSFKLFFECWVKHGIIYVQANALMLDELGY